jgi:DNA-binding beta-propeller fold protein YncE
VKLRTSFVCLLCLCPALLPAQTIDFNAARSAEQLRAGVQAFHRGFYNDAAISLEKSISDEPTNSLAQIWLGRAQWKSGYEQEAQRTWQQVLDSGKGGALVRQWVDVLTFRRGLGAELAGKPTWVVSGELDGTLNGGYPFRRPTSIRPRADGTFWLVAFGSNEILHFDANFRLLEVLRGGLPGFDRPYDVVEADDGTLYVSEYGANRIARCNARGEKISTFGRSGSSAGSLLGPQYMTLDRRGYLWVTDWGNERVARFSLDGAYVQSITGIQGPTGIVALEERLYVSDKPGKRVLVYDLNGNPLPTIGEGKLQGPEGLSVSSAGTLLVADGNRIMECDLERETWTVRGDTSAHTKRLVQQASTVNGDVLGADFDQSRVVLLSDVTTLYSGLVVRVDRVNSVKFPEVYADVSVENKYGKPVAGLGIENFIVTEALAGVRSPVLVVANTRVKTADISLLLERSPALESNLTRPNVEQAVADLYGLATQTGRIKSISAAEKPAREADFGETRLRFVRESLQASPSPRWRFDLGVRLAGDELITAVSAARRAVVFFTSGSLGERPFTTYSVLELADYLRNNAIGFYPVIFGSQPPDDDLSYLSSATGGEIYNVSAPGGMQEVVRDINARVGPVYTLRFTSVTPPDFGDRYIPLEIEVTVQKASGRDESGYYAPATTGLPSK